MTKPPRKTQKFDNRRKTVLNINRVDTVVTGLLPIYLINQTFEK